MTATKALASSLVVLLLFACSRHITTSVARETRPKARSLAQLVSLKKVTPLTNSDLSLGAIAKVLEHKDTKDLFVTDGSWSNRVYRFSAGGSYRGNVGVNDYEPGRNRKLLDFEASDTHIYLLTETSLLRIDMTSRALVASTELPVSALRLVRIDGQICVITTQTGMVCFDETLGQRDIFLTREIDLLRRHVFVSHMPLAGSGGRVLLAEFYSPSVLLIDLKRRVTSAVSFPGSEWDAVAFSEIWNGKDRGDFSEPDVRKIHNSVRRMWKAVPLPDGQVLLLDRQREPKRNEFLIFDPLSLTAERHDGDLAVVRGLEGVGYNILDRIIGYSATGLIGDIPNNLVAGAMASVWPEANTCKDAWQCLYFIEFAKH